MNRRAFLRSLAVAGASVAVPPAVLHPSDLARPGPSPYGELGGPDPNGIRLPEGFTSRVVARSGDEVAGTGHRWHRYPDGGATFRTPGGWVYVSNSEVSDGRGGVGAVAFAGAGSIAGAYSICEDTSRNCSGGATPWGTWLSCEEFDEGQVWECDPTGNDTARNRPALGTFKHEAAAVDPIGRRVYLTEDERDGCFYRFTPAQYPNLTAGVLEVAVLTDDSGGVTWVEVPAPHARDQATRYQVTAATPFLRGEGAGYHDGTVYFTTTGDNRVWAYDTRDERLTILYDGGALEDPPLRGVDNVAVSELGEVLVAEDGDDMQLFVITPAGAVAPLLQVVGDEHEKSEVTGPAFDPSGTRLYFSSQRAFNGGITYEVTGPFGRTGSSPAPPDDGDSIAPLGLGALGVAAVALGLGVGIRRRAAHRRTEARQDETARGTGGTAPT